MAYSSRRKLESVTPSNSIIGLESALSYYRMCSFADQYIVTESLGGKFNINSRYYKIVSSNTLRLEDVVPYEPSKGRLKITTPEATICEMIARDRRDDFIIESLQSYVIFKESPSYVEEKLFLKSKEYGVYERLMEYLDWAYEDLDDMC